MAAIGRGGVSYQRDTPASNRGKPPPGADDARDERFDETEDTARIRRLEVHEEEEEVMQAGGGSVQVKG